MKQANKVLRKRYGKARAPIEIDPNDPRWADVCKRIMNPGPSVSQEEKEKLMHWLRTSKIDAAEVTMHALTDGRP